MRGMLLAIALSTSVGSALAAEDWRITTAGMARPRSA